ASTSATLRSKAPISSMVIVLVIAFSSWRTVCHFPPPPKVEKPLAQDGRVLQRAFDAVDRPGHVCSRAPDVSMSGHASTATAGTATSRGMGPEKADSDRS